MTILQKNPYLFVRMNRNVGLLKSPMSDNIPLCQIWRPFQFQYKIHENLHQFYISRLFDVLEYLRECHDELPSAPFYPFFMEISEIKNPLRTQKKMGRKRYIVSKVPTPTKFFYFKQGGLHEQPSQTSSY